MTTIAEPIVHRGEDVPVCKHCHQGIKRVPVGQGPPWVHDTGYRACSPIPDAQRWPDDESWPGDEDDGPDDDLVYELRHDK